MMYRILLVAHDVGIRTTRGTVLSKAGYNVTTTQTAQTALTILKKQTFDLILVGRDSLPPLRSDDQVIREQYPDVLILKVVDLVSREKSYSSELTESAPERLLASIEAMLATQKARDGLAANRVD